MHLRSALFLSLAALLSTAGPGAAQVLTWNNTGTDFAAAGSWTPNQVPSAATVTQFTPSGALPFVPGTVTATPVNNPVLSAAQAVSALTFAPTPQLLGGWTLTGNGNTLTIGGTGSTGLTVRRGSSQRLTDVLLQGASTTDFLTLNVDNGGALILGGTTATGNFVGPNGLGTLNGTLTLDNTGTSVAARIGTSPLFNLAGATINLLGNAAGGTYTVGALTGGSTAGTITFRASPPATGGGAATLQFNNTAAFSSRLSTFSVLRFEAGNGATLGSSAVITFNGGVPGLGANGLLANTTAPTSTSGTFGYALAADAGGTDFATFGGLAAGVVRAGATTTAATLAGLTSTDNTSRAQYNPAANDTSGTRTIGSLRITPAAAGLTLDLGAGNLVTNALMLDGANDFAVAGTGLFGANGTRYIYVNDPAVALTTGLSVVNGTNPTGFGGPGVLILNGTGVQAGGQPAAAVNRLDLHGGTVRGTNANLGFQLPAAGSDTFAAINFRGGVVEIAGGANGTGAAADFTRGLGSLDGQVRWEGGAGGFGAFGSPASVNIGGAASPTALQWATPNFVQDGFALRFGSLRANAVLNFLNPIQLDNGTAYQLREVAVFNSGGFANRTVFQGVVSGAANADLLKSSLGILVLAAANTYAGNTFISGGGVIAAGTGVSTGRVLVGGSATFLYPGTIATTDVRPAPATLTTGPVAFRPSATFRVRVTGAVTTQAADSGASGTPGTSNSLLSAAGGITFGAGSLFVVDLTGVNYTSGTGVPYSFRIGEATSGSNVISGSSVTSGISFIDNDVNITSLITGANVQLSGNGVFLNFTPVPEPATVLAIAAVGLGGLRLRRAFRRVR